MGPRLTTLASVAAIVLLALQTAYYSAAVPQLASGGSRRHEILVPEGVLNALRARGVPEEQLEPHKRNRKPPTVTPRAPLVRPLAVTVTVITVMAQCCRQRFLASQQPVSRPLRGCFTSSLT